VRLRLEDQVRCFRVVSVFDLRLHFSTALSADPIPSPSLMTHPSVPRREACCNEVMRRLAANYQLLVFSAISGIAHKKNCLAKI